MPANIEPLVKVRSTTAVRYAATFLWPTLSWILLAWAFSGAAAKWNGDAALVAMSWAACAVAFVLAYGMARALITGELPATYCAGLAKLEAELRQAGERFQRQEAESAFDMADWPEGTRVEASNGWWRDSDGRLRRIVFVRLLDSAPDAPTWRAEFIVRFNQEGYLEGYEIRGLPEGL
jgi:hypothetical protein